MNLGRFVRKRALIEGREGRNGAWRKRALRHLVREAGAEIVSSGKRVVGYLMPDGAMACHKQRFSTQGKAASMLAMIAAEEVQRTTRPVRAYGCRHCGGWHLTSKANKYATTRG